MATPQKGRVSQAGPKKNPDFQPYNVTPESAHTAVVLLESKEPEILCHVRDRCFLVFIPWHNR